MKQERQSVFVASSNLENVQHPSDTTYFVKHEEQTENENDISRPSVSECNMSENLATITNSQVAASPIFSQPNPPARLYFSPTLLQDEADIDDDEQSSTNESRTIGEKQQVLSTLDQNQIGIFSFDQANCRHKKRNDFRSGQSTYQCPTFGSNIST